jgi:tripartite ATP-independent transporter DctM subunit
MLPELPLDLMMFAALIGAILLGYPVAFTIAGVAVLFALLGWWLDAFSLNLMGAMGQRFFAIMTNPVLTAIPLFVLMGVVLEKSRIAEDLLETMGRLFGRLRGGLGLSVVLVGALLAASTGIVGATVVAMGLIALPAMLRNGYNPPLAAGTVATAGTLGQIIPPSTLLIILAEVMSSAFQQAQYREGRFTIETISVGQTFAAALVPGLLLVVLYILYILARAWLRPQDAPAMAERGGVSRAEVAGAILPPVLLIFAVLGAILGGVASPNEAASVGAVGAILLAGYRQGAPKALIVAGAGAFLAVAVLAGLMPVRLQRSDAGAAAWAMGALYGGLILVGVAALAAALAALFRNRLMVPALAQTMVVTAMIFATILMASVFSLVFVGLGGEHRVAAILESLPGGATGALVFAMVFVFVLGFFLDFVEISVILLPLLIPPLILMGHDPIWLAVLLAVNLQTSFLTPPFGFSLFYLRGAAPKEVTTGMIYRGVAPFIALQILAVAIIWLFPTIATWLPRALF